MNDMKKNFYKYTHWVTMTSGRKQYIKTSCNREIKVKRLGAYDETG